MPHSYLRGGVDTMSKQDMVNDSVFAVPSKHVFRDLL